MQFKTLAFLSILSILFFTGCSSDNEKTNESKNEIEKVKANISTYKLTTTDNSVLNVSIEDNKITFKEYPNKIVLLNFFATWCPPCKAEIPNLIKLQNKYEKDFAVISILLEKDKANDEINKFVQDFKINYPVTNSQVNFSISDKLGPIRTIPTMFMIGKDSTVFQKYVGVVPFEMMEIDINKLLKKVEGN